MDPGDRLYNQISDPSDQREHHSSYVCEPGTGRSSTCLWQRQKSSLAAGIASYAGTSYFIRFLLIFVSSLTELTLSSMLASAGTKTIGLTIFNFQQSGDYNLSAAMSAVIVVMVLTGYCLVALKPAEKRREEKNMSLYLEHITQRFGQTLALNDIDLEIRNGEFLAILGPSGCGKTTLCGRSADLQNLQRERYGWMM